MNVGLFGGTFDPIHRGHLAVARAARERFNLGRIHFVPAYFPPHKMERRLAAYEHRYTMVAFATLGEKSFLPSLLEASGQALFDPRWVGAGGHGGGSGSKPPQANYSINTVRRLKQQLGPRDKLFFLIGIDAFLDIASWREPEALLGEAEFIVAARPGFALADVAEALPKSLRPPAATRKPFGRQPARGTIALPGAKLHLLENVREPVSATDIRVAARSGRKLDRLVGPAVAEYIRKMGLYKK